MSVIKELIRTEEDGTISFGNYELDTKSKLSDFEHDGDMYKVKTYNEITKLERNGMFVYESVPGTTVLNLNVEADGMSFKVEGPKDAQITVELEEDAEYSIKIDDVEAVSYTHLPSFCGTGYYGLKVHEGVLKRGVKVTGATVHFVDEGTDTGPIILQKAVEVKQEDTPEVLQRRVMEEAEWKIMPKAIDLIANGKVEVVNGLVKIKE